MINIDARLDARLRSFYEHIEEQHAPRGFESFEAPRRSRRRRSLNLVAGIAGVAVVAAGVSIFAEQLASHRNPRPPAATGSKLPTNAQLTFGLPSISRTVIEVMRGHGSASLPTFTPQGIIFLESACDGSGAFSVASPDNRVGFTAEGCDSGSIGGVAVPADLAIDGKPLSLAISAEPSTEWEIVVADSGPVPPLPVLGFSSAPANAHVLNEGTYGTGTSTVDVTSFTGQLYALYACTGIGVIDFAVSNGSETIHTRGGCANGDVGTAAIPALHSFSGLLNVTVTTASKTLWEIVLYELPAAKS